MMTRKEADSIGTMEVPLKAYYGVQTLRAKNNFHITGQPLHVEFIRNPTRIKKAAACTNITAHVLDERTGNAIIQACDEIIGGKLHQQFIVDAIQGGAGTSANMNANEVRLLSSGPKAGLGDINLPPKQNGSSIMPGKINPVIPEVVSQVAFNVIGNDITVTMAAEAGQDIRWNTIRWAEQPRINEERKPPLKPEKRPACCKPPIFFQFFCPTAASQTAYQTQH